MSKLIEVTDINLERTDLLRRHPLVRSLNKKGHLAEISRTKTMHLSGVLRYLSIESGMLKVTKDIDEEHLPARMALGLAWEEFAVSLYPEIHWQPGEEIVDGVAMTCDGVSVRDDAMAIEEFKLTWKRAKSGQEVLKEEWYWMQQGRGYCRGYDARLVRWHVCFVNGDYRGSGPIYRRYVVLFSDMDVESTWQMILKNKPGAVEKGYSEC